LSVKDTEVCLSQQAFDGTGVLRLQIDFLERGLAIAYMAISPEDLFVGTKM
jgi:hypothetical protein